MEMVPNWVYAVLLIHAVVCASYSYLIADAKGWQGSSWAIGGFLFGVLALIAAAGLPDLETRRAIEGLRQSTPRKEINMLSIPEGQK